jgi:Uma2 family endonuclease
MRYEVINGVLYMAPSPLVAHQSTLLELATRMREHCIAHDLGKVFIAPLAVRLPGQTALVQPDIFFVAKERLEIVGQATIEGAPDLVVEILSPGNWHYDRGVKQEAYRQAGVREYWIVDPRAKSVEVLSLVGAEYETTSTAAGAEAAHSRLLAGFAVPAEALFT